MAGVPLPHMSVFFRDNLFFQQSYLCRNSKLFLDLLKCCFVSLCFCDQLVTFALQQLGKTSGDPHEAELRQKCALKMDG